MQCKLIGGQSGNIQSSQKDLMSLCVAAMPGKYELYDMDADEH